MRFNLILVILFAFILFACVEEKKQTVQVESNNKTAESVLKGESMEWVYNFQEALKSAKEQGKPLMVDFYAEWCSWCKKLDKDVYANPEVIELSKNFISVKINTDKDPKTAKEYNIEGLPTVIFLSPDGDVVESFVGYRNSGDFIKVMTDIINKNARSK